MRKLLVILSILFAGAAARGDEVVDYMRAVKPIFAARCVTCHGALKQKGGLRVDTAAAAIKGGKAGPALVRGNSGKSLLIDHILERNDAERMPPESEGEALKPKEVALLKAWIDQGAAAPADEKPETDPRDHWAFKVPVRPAIAKPGNPIDVLVSAKWEKLGLTPQPPADKGTLLRRVYLDLIGLPPTLAERAAFLADASPDAYEKVVDRLLASKQYGERWGRHWMDIWRFSDWWGLGADIRSSQKHMWHWRDWIIESLNADKGYDQMVREMLAADELYPTDPDKLRGSGFLVRQYFKFNRSTWLEETVEHTSKAFLGLTVNCAKCHDHKYDPISQQDFYRMRAFFEPYQVRTDMIGGETDVAKDGLPRAFDCNLDTPTYLFIRGDEKRPKTDAPIGPGVPTILAFDELKITPVKLPVEAYAPGLSPAVLDAKYKAFDTQVEAAKKALETARKTAPDGDGLLEEKKGKGDHSKLAIAAAEKALAVALLRKPDLQARIAADKARMSQPAQADAKQLAQAASKLERQLVAAVAEEAVAKAELEAAEAPKEKAAAATKKLKEARDAFAKAKKAADAPGEAYTTVRGSVKTPESNIETVESQNKPFPTTSTGRRTALAAWITDPRNPLAARVAANHIWARHFGMPLVPTVFDFGRKGAAPSNPELLDYLAVELRDAGWSMKKLHRLMVTSNVYRMTSSTAGASAGNLAADGENKYLWRMNAVRMESQVVRDSLLALSGDLDRTVGGPPVAATDDSSKRRSVYFFHSHNDHNKFLVTFDDASVLECYRRGDSIVPQQALALENSKLVLATAAKIVNGIHEKDDAAFIGAAFSLILGTPPTADETAACSDALRELQSVAAADKKPDPGTRARVNLVHALLNHNDFVTIR